MSDQGEQDSRTTAATLAAGCLVSVVAAVLFEGLSPVEDAGAVIVIPVVIASLFLGARTALITLLLAMVGELTNLRFGYAEAQHVIENAMAFLLAFAVGRIVGAQLGTRRILLRDPDAHLGLLRRLTPREAEVISLVLEGLTAREIGRRLSLADRTVETHIAIAYAKLGIHDRSALARLFIGQEGVPRRRSP